MARENGVQIVSEDRVSVLAHKSQLPQLQQVRDLLIGEYGVHAEDIRMEPLGVSGNQLELVAKVVTLQTYQEQILARIKTIMGWSA